MSAAKVITTKLKCLRSQLLRDKKKPKSGSAGGTTKKWWLEDKLHKALSEIGQM